MPEKGASLERDEAIQEENRNLRYLQSLVDAALMAIRDGRLYPEAAAREWENIRSLALELFPGKETVFDLIYRPRFQRAITETFKLHC